MMFPEDNQYFVAMLSTVNNFLEEIYATHIIFPIVTVIVFLILVACIFCFLLIRFLVYQLFLEANKEFRKDNSVALDPAKYNKLLLSCILKFSVYALTLGAFLAGIVEFSNIEYSKITYPFQQILPNTVLFIIVCRFISCERIERFLVYEGTQCMPRYLYSNMYKRGVEYFEYLSIEMYSHGILLYSFYFLLVVLHLAFIPSSFSKFVGIENTEYIVSLYFMLFSCVLIPYSLVVVEHHYHTLRVLLLAIRDGFNPTIYRRVKPICRKEEVI